MSDDQNNTGGLIEAVGSDFPTSTDEAPGDSSSSRLVQEFCIDSAERANWLVRRIVEARAYGNRVRTWAEMEQRRAEREEERLFQRFGGQLQHWVAAELGKSRHRRKSINLPAGIIGFRHVGPRLVIEDETAVLEWARVSCPHAIVSTTRLDRATFGSHVETTGDIPAAGVKVKPGHEAFFIR